jgi:hypothetical protein
MSAFPSVGIGFYIKRRISSVRNRTHYHPRGRVVKGRSGEGLGEISGQTASKSPRIVGNRLISSRGQTYDSPRIPPVTEENDGYLTLIYP